MQAEAIKKYILKNVKKHPNDIVANTAEKFAVTRTTVHRHLNALLRNHLIFKSGTTRNIMYYPAASLDRECHYKISPSLSEFEVLRNDFDDVFKQFPENVYDICSYGFTEIFNNAIEHSRGTKITVATAFKNSNLSLAITDNGVGVFKTIFDYFHLDDLRESILQLNKGKMTTDPANHTGEGIFFCSRTFDLFEIFANNLHYVKDNIENDWAVESIKRTKSDSCVKMTIAADTIRNLTQVFKTYQDPDSLAFDRTEVLVELAKFGDEKLISRSQAKRIVRGLEKFRQVTLDFTGVKLVGQGFVDEIFRVYANKHPHISLHYIHANDDVAFMIKRGLATSQ